MNVTFNQINNALGFTSELAQFGVQVAKLQDENQITEAQKQFAQYQGEYQTALEKDPENEKIWEDYQNKIQGYVKTMKLTPGAQRRMQAQIDASMENQKTDFDIQKYQIQAKRGIVQSQQYLQDDLSTAMQAGSTQEFAQKVQEAYLKYKNVLVDSGFVRDYEYDVSFAGYYQGAVEGRAQLIVQNAAKDAIMSSTPAEAKLIIDKKLQLAMDEMKKINIVGMNVKNISPGTEGNVSTVETKNTEVISGEESKNNQEQGENNSGDFVSTVVKNSLYNRMGNLGDQVIKDVQNMKLEKLGERKNDIILENNIPMFKSFLESDEVINWIDQDVRDSWIKEYLSMIDRQNGAVDLSKKIATDDYIRKDLALRSSGASPEQRMEENVKAQRGKLVDAGVLTSYYEMINDNNYNDDPYVKASHEKIDQLTKPDKKGKQKLSYEDAAQIEDMIRQYYIDNPQGTKDIPNLLNNYLKTGNDQKAADAAYKSAHPGWLGGIFNTWKIDSIEEIQLKTQNGQTSCLINNGRLVSDSFPLIAQNQSTQVQMFLSRSKDLTMDDITPRVITNSSQVIYQKDKSQSLMPGQTLIDNNKKGYTFRYYIPDGKKENELQIYNLQTKKWEKYNDKKSYLSWLNAPGSMNADWNNYTLKQKRTAWGVK